MMLTGLHNPSKTLPLDGMLGKSQPADSETSQPVSFGEILKRKEKQLQQEQEVSASSIAAALAALQTLPIASSLPMPGTETVEANESTSKAEAVGSSSDGVRPPAVTSLGTSESSAASQQATARLAMTESAAPAPGTFSTLQTLAAPQQPVAQLQSTPVTFAQISKSETATTPATLTNKGFTSDAVPTSFTSSSSETLRVDTAVNKPVSYAPDDKSFATISETRDSQPVIKTETRVEVGVEQSATYPQPELQTTKELDLPVQAPSANSVMQNTKADDFVSQGATAKAPGDDPSSSVPVEKSASEAPTSLTPTTIKNRDLTAGTASEPTIAQQRTTATLKTAEAEFAPASSAGETSGSVTDVVSQAQAETFSLEPDPVMVTGKTSVEPRAPQSVNAKSPATIEQTTKMPVAFQVEDQPDASVLTTLENESEISAKSMADKTNIPETESTASSTVFEFEKVETSPVDQSAVHLTDAEIASSENKSVLQAQSSGIKQPSIESVVAERADFQEAVSNFKPTVIDVEMASQDTRPEAVISEAEAEPNQAQTSVYANDLPWTETTVREKHLPASSEQLNIGTTTTDQASNAASSPKLASVAPDASISKLINPEVKFQADLPVAENNNTELENVDTQPSAAGTFEAKDFEQRLPGAGSVAVSSATGSMQTEKGAAERPETEALPQNPTASATEAHIPVPENDDRQNENVDTSTVQQTPQTVINSDATDTQFVQQTADSVEVKEKSNTSRPSFTNKAEVPATETSVQFAATSDQVVSASSGVGNVEELKEALKTKRAGNEETVEPVEKQPEPNQMSGAVAHANGPVKESVAAEPSKNIPSGQINAQAAEVAQQVISHLRSNIKSGPTSMHLQLNPKELGAIDVQMVSSSEGLQVTFFAEQLNTGKLLESQLPQLRESLMDSGVQLSGLNISQHNHSGQKGETFGQNPNFAQTSQRDLPQGKPGNQDDLPAARSIGKSSEVDYLI